MATRENDPEVSAIIATYNMGQFLDNAIQSVLSQSCPNLELLVIDDGSTDNTREVVASFETDSRLRYYWQPNSGQTRAKNVGINLSRGRFIAFCDADDQWTTDKIQLQLPAFNGSEQIAVVYSRSHKIDTDGLLIVNGENLRSFPSGKVTQQLFIENFVCFGTAMIRRNCLFDTGVFDETLRMGIDWDLWLRLSTKYEFCYVDAVTYLYRVWPGQMSRNWRGRYENCFNIMQDFLEKYPGFVSKKTISEAWAHTYTSRGRIRSYQSGEHFRAMIDIIKATHHLPSYWPAWRLIGRILLNFLGYRKP